MKKLFLIPIILLSLGAYSQEDEDTLSPCYINDKQVSLETFQRFLDMLKPIDETWYCDEMEEGGQTGYDAKDETGLVYRYYCLSHPTEGHCSIKLVK